MADGAAIYLETFRSAMRPEPRLSVSEWAQEHRRLSQRASSEPGRWRNERTPFLVEIMDSLSTHDETEVVVLMKGAQIGGTEAGNNWIGYIIDIAPGPTMMVAPTVQTAQRASKQRITPMIEESERLRMRVRSARSRDSGNTILVKEFADGSGILIITGANSAVGLRSMPVRYLFLDEVDGYDMNADGEGDPTDIAFRRTATFSRNRKIFIVSTPTMKGLSKIESLYEQTDMRVFMVPCPHCGLYQSITWAKIAWPKNEETGEHLIDQVHMVCEGCNEKIEESSKTEMLSAGEWKPTNDNPERKRWRGYHLSSLYSPAGWYSWRQAAEEQLAAKKRGDEALQVFANTVLGETWEDEGFGISSDGLMGRREKYDAPSPKGVLMAVMGVDVQDDRLEVEVLGIGRNMETWSLEYKVIYGDPDRDDVWEHLDDFIESKYDRPRQGGRKVPPMTIYAVGIDSGGHHTQRVYDYCKRRRGRRVFALKGMAGEARPIVSSPTHRRSGKGRRKVELYTVGVDNVKGMVYNFLGISELSSDGSPGYCHFPLSEMYTTEYFKQLTAERAITRYHKGYPRREWVKTRPRNEALDVRVYAFATFYIINPDLAKFEKRLNKERDGDDGGKKGGGTRRRSGGYVTNWQ